MDDPAVEFPHQVGMLRKEWKNACTFEDILAAVGVYSTSSTDFNVRNTCLLQPSTKYTGLKSIELVTRGLTKLRKLTSPRCSIGPKPT